MYVCAKLSALEGVWNEQRRDEASFVTAVRRLAGASVAMQDAILARRADAVFISSESGEFFQASSPDPEVTRVATFENERRFLPLDLIYAKPCSETMREHAFAHGMPAEEYEGFMRRKPPKRSVLGVDYYDWNEKLIDTEGRPQALGELFGWYVIASQYWERYGLPMMHTETNHLDAREAPRWLWRQWHNVSLIRQAGVPVVGFTWYSLTDQVDWDAALAEPLGNVNPVGLFDLNRDPRAVGEAYKHLIETFQGQPDLAECPALKEVLA
jgi:beta-glucosidase/6-phospho-beta-glucosidase/beta-galactosidase